MKERQRGTDLRSFRECTNSLPLVPDDRPELIMSEGERVIRGTRRPDGTYRKDVKVRAGYTPQDEQPVYVPRGAQVKLQYTWRSIAVSRLRG